MGLQRTAGVFLLLATLSASIAQAELVLTQDEIQQILAHGPWPIDQHKDPSNRVSGNSDAIALGKHLFGDRILSRDGTLSCTTCHRPDRDFSEYRPRSLGRKLLDRNTPALLNLSAHRWFGWGGSSDNLWGQTILPIVNPDEMAHDSESLKSAILKSQYASSYEQIFGSLQHQPSQTVLVNIAKTLAAYQETLTTGKTSFDRFRDSLARGDMKGASSYPGAAQRGLQIFIGKGRCSFCHSGANFTNGEFHDAAVPYFLGPGRVDAGRHAGLKTLLQSPYTLDGVYNDDPLKTGAWAVRTVKTTHADFGIFRVPSLRGVAHTSPYMHDGSLPDLKAVVEHYNTINTERLHADGEQILRPLKLSGREKDDLIAFLESLSDH
ncbi:MAG: cytochrome c peroxidase [Rhizobiaceae bacterium]